MKIVRIRQESDDRILVEWDDGRKGWIPLETLRNACPCAGCAGETVLLRKSEPRPQDFSAPGRYQLRALEPVGNYALRPAWGDGHHEGLFTWEQMQLLFVEEPAPEGTLRV
ncbi:MAG: DUF971 domain-containing protein [Bacteroidota bacterium]